MASGFESESSPVVSTVGSSPGLAPLLEAPTKQGPTVGVPDAIGVPEDGTNAAAVPPQSSPLVATAPVPSHDFVFPDSTGLASLSTPFNQSTNVIGPASELLLVTPQMLVEFFKPLPATSNLGPARVLVPVDVGFRPPLASPGPSSQAIYRSQ